MNHAKRASAAIDTLIEAANSIAMKEIERQVRVLLSKHKGWAFTMAMGDAFFWQRESDDSSYRAWMGPVIAFIHKHNGTLKLTGQPMRIETHDGPLLTDW